MIFYHLLKDTQLVVSNIAENHQKQWDLRILPTMQATK
jgi:hypothetical protein